MPYLEKYNSDDIHARSIIAGLLAFLNQEVFIINTWNKEDKEQEIVEIPFYYSTTGDERYLQDFFAHTWNSCYKAGLEGNFDAIPRGTIKLDSSNIDTGALTQRFIRGNFNRVIKKIEGGELKGENLESFSAYINSIPQTFEFSCEIRTDTLTDAFKIQQTIIEVFYKSKAFYTTYKGVLVPCQVGFPEQIGIEKQFEFSYPSDNTIKLTFSLSVETYLPVIDEPNQGSNNAIANVNKMNDWLNNKPTTSIDTIDSNGIYGKQMLGNDNAYYIGESRREMVKARLGHNSYSENEGAADNNWDYTKDNNSYEMSSIRKNSNRMEEIVLGEFTDAYTDKKLELSLSKTECHAGEEIDIQWKSEGWIHKIDLYCYNKDINGNKVNVTQIAKYIPESKKEYSWHIPINFCTSGNTANIAINSSTGKGKNAKAYAIIDDGGMVSNIVIENEGSGYDDTVVFEIEMDGTPANLVPVVQYGKITDCIIRNAGNYVIEGYDEHHSNELYILAVSTAGNIESNEIQLTLI